ncbi:unnamed protein product [Absidia cylindrospora]
MAALLPYTVGVNYDEDKEALNTFFTNFKCAASGTDDMELMVENSSTRIFCKKLWTEKKQLSLLNLMTLHSLKTRSTVQFNISKRTPNIISTCSAK